MMWNGDDDMLTAQAGPISAHDTAAVSGHDDMIPKSEGEGEVEGMEIELRLDQRQKQEEKENDAGDHVGTLALVPLSADSSTHKEEVKSLFGSSIFGGESGGEGSQSYATNTSLLLGNWSSEILGNTYSWESQSAVPQMMALSG